MAVTSLQKTVLQEIMFITRSNRNIDGKGIVIDAAGKSLSIKQNGNATPSGITVMNDRGTEENLSRDKVELQQKN